MSKRIGAYICTGCGIGESLNIEALVELAEDELDAVACRTHSLLCSAEGVKAVKDFIEEEKLEIVIIAACSPRVHVDTFDFGPQVLVERVNLREQVVWCHPANDEDTQMLAEDNLRMGMAKARSLEAPVPYLRDDFSRAILVVGGGLAGLTAALEAARTGYEVILVEKEQELGGWVGRLYKQVPLNPPYQQLEEPAVFELIEQVKNDPAIKVYTGARIVKTMGAPGLFEVIIAAGDKEVTERAGAIVLAAGAVAYDASRLAHLGYGSSPDVITTEQLENMLRRGQLVRPSDGKPVKNVAFVLCAGSREENHLPYCSNVCCLEALKQALIVKEQDPTAGVYIFYRDIRTPGHNEFFYKRVQQAGVVFIKNDGVFQLSRNGNGLVVQAEDKLFGRPVELENVDLVVLATGIVPVTALAVDKNEEESAGEQLSEAAVTAENKPTDAIIKANILNLEYRQGPELPPLKYGFPDSHFICFPYETRRTGIYAAGSVRAPLDIASTIEDAVGAAMKAIQCVEMVTQGRAVHPRSGDLSYPEFFMQRCTQCKRCTEECPFGAINEDEKANPLPNPTRCRRCGVCMGACPERIISFKNYSVAMIGNMIKAIHVPEEFEEKPRILVLACENDAYPTLDMAGMMRLTYNPWVRIIPLRCLGSMNLIWIADAMSKGIDGVLLMGCRHGDDYQCHFIKGSELAQYRLSKVSETLDRLQLESERVQMVTINIMDYHRIPEILDEFAARLEEIGPNPMKGF